MSKTENKRIGKSYLIDLGGIKTEDSEDSEKIEMKLRKIADKFNTSPLKWDSHNFSPKGFTGILLLKESHISIHTWPEKDYIAIDFFTCGNAPKKNEVKNIILELFQPKIINIEEIERGIF